MSVQSSSSSIYFHLGTVFMVLSIAASFFLLYVISICCTWGEELADEELTFMIREDDESNNHDSVSTQNRDSNIIKNEAVYDAIQEWDLRIDGLIFREVQSRYEADIEIRFREGESDVAGLTRNFFDRYGLITKSFVTIYDRGFPFAFSNDQIEQIAKH